MIAEVATQIALAETPPADPWDAPYFGGIVYFSYQPTQLPSLSTSPGDAAVEAPGHTANAWEPWDAPYFGAPIYLRFPEFVAGNTAIGAQIGATPQPGEPAPTLAMPAPTDAGAGEEKEEHASHPASPAERATAAAQVVGAAQQHWLRRLFGWRSARR